MEARPHPDKRHHIFFILEVKKMSPTRKLLGGQKRESDAKLTIGFFTGIHLGWDALTHMGRS